MKRETQMSDTRRSHNSLLKVVSFSRTGFLFFSCATLFLTSGLRSQNTTSSGYSPEAERAIVRTQENLISAQAKMKDALLERSDKNLETAYRYATESLQLTPSGGPSSGNIRASIVSNYTGISLAYARELIANGHYSEAESVAKSVLDPSVNPGNKDAIRLLSDLEQPEVFNKTITPEFAADRQKVTDLLREAYQLEQSGRHALAIKQYEAVLRIDPYNSAARKGMEAVNNASIKYSDEAYNETRSRMLWQVDKAWERPPSKSTSGRSTESMGHQQDIRGTDQIVAKLNSIIIPKINLIDAPISEAVDYLKQKSVEQDPDRKGVNIFLKLDSESSTSPAKTSSKTESKADSPTAEPQVTLSLSQVPLYVALEYISKLTNLKLKIDPYAVSIVPLAEPTDVLITKEYRVPPNFIPLRPLDAGTDHPTESKATNMADWTAMARIASRYNAQEYLLSQGVAFPKIGNETASANYIPSGSKLVVRDTRDNLDMIDSLVDAATGVAPTQVDIQTKFLDIQQNNLQELGFDWLLGPFSVGGGVYGSGGGLTNSVNSAEYPFGTSYGQLNPVGALRSGDAAILGNSVNQVIANGPGGRINTSPNAPGIFSVAGIFSNPQFQMVINALNQKKGIDLMAAPKVTTKSGQKAVVKITQEFIYPTQYDPPQVPQSTSNNALVSIPPTITPSFPRDFKMEPIGIILEAKPTIGPDGYTIDLELNPRVTDFDGFINYGSPINAVGYTNSTVPGLLTPYAQTLTTNVIKQPVFSLREVNTFVTVWDGQTVALGGLITENVQKTQDKVPILGDIPLAGRLFRSDADQKIKENLIIFVTPRILDADGQYRRADTDEPEIVTPIGLPQNLPQPKLSTRTSSK